MIQSRKISSVRFLVFSVVLLSGVGAFAQQKKEVAAKVEAVTVFLNRAQVSNSAKTNVAAGVTEVVLSNIPKALDVNSIQVAARGNVIVTGVKYDTNYLQEEKRTKENQALQDSLDYYQSLVRTLTDQNDIYRKEEAMVQANQSIGGQKGVAVEDLEEVADFFRKRLFTIRVHIQENDKRLAKANASLQRYSDELWGPKRQQHANGRILIYVSADRPASVNLEVSYVVYNAGWQPLYDLRATNTKSPVKLAYKAKVFQNTGIEWPDVKLTLSTTNPAVGATKPELAPWYLSLPEKLRRQSAMTSKIERKEAAELTSDEKALGFDEPGDNSWGAAEAPAATMAEYTQAVQTELAVDFQIKMPYSIPAGNVPVTVDVQESELLATYAYAAVPKMEQAAFLMAQLTNWEQFNLLPGEASIFFENTFTGKTFLDPAVSDTISFSLGRDKKVQVQHEKVKELKSKSFLGNSTKETSGYLLTVRNTKDQPITITVEDQIPVSNNSGIEVELLESSGGVLDKATGKISWQLTLKPNEAKKLPLKFAVKHPKNQPVIGL